MKFNIVKLFWAFLATCLIGAIFGVSAIVYFSFSLPKIASLSDYNPSIPSKILSRDGEILAEIGHEKREVAAIEDIPEKVIDCFLAAEDDSFYEHQGVDYLGVLRALVVNLRAGKVVQGGSTITQQVAKSFLLSNERSVTRKIKDFLLALKIEKKFTKPEILYLYLNQVYLGGGYYGVKSAFKGYFDKELDEATSAEAALVAGLLVAPGRYSPYINPKFALARQHYVLRRLRDTGKITNEEFERSISEKIKLRLRKTGEFKAGYFTDWVRRRVIEKFGEENFLTGGYKIVTTLDWELQQVAEKEVAKGVRAIDKRQGFKGPLEHIEPETLEVMKERISNMRKENYRDQSLFFTIGEDDQREYEIDFNQDEVQKVLERISDQKFSKLKNYVPGNDLEDNFHKNIKVGEIYKGIVEKVLDKERLIFVDIGGLKGIISYEYFRWAHERTISEERQYFGQVTRPSTIVKPGDVILAELLDKNTSISKMIWRQALEDFKKSKDYDVLKDENYLMLALEQEPEAQGALVSLRPDTGEIISLVGGADFKKSQFNRANQSLRQPGSSFKPLLFAAALENGFQANSIILDSPEALGGAEQSINWKPRNYDGKFKGPITFREALEQSRNVPTIKLAYDVGVSKITSFMQRVGLKAEMDPDLSLSLGSFGVTLLDITSTYAIFPNGGKIIDPISIVSITDRFGTEFQIDERIRLGKVKEAQELALEESKKTIAESEVENGEEAEQKVVKNPYLETIGGSQVYDHRLAYIMTNILKGVVNNPGGTGRAAREVSTFLGGKTGTTNSFVDAWFLGFSQNIVTGTWAGLDDNSPLGWGETGATSALPIWLEYMRVALKKYGEFDFRAPPGIVNVKIDKSTGQLASGNDGFLEAFVMGTEPGADSEDSENIVVPPANNGEVFEDDEYYSNQ